jgi:hypothetical protein
MQITIAEIQEHIQTAIAETKKQEEQTDCGFTKGFLQGRRGTLKRIQALTKKTKDVKEIKTQIIKQFNIHKLAISLQPTHIPAPKDGRNQGAASAFALVFNLLP